MNEPANCPHCGLNHAFEVVCRQYIDHSFNNPGKFDSYPHDSSKLLEWHERRHNNVHTALDLAGIKGAWRKLAEDRVNDLVSERDVARIERDAARAELEKLRADHDALGNDMDAVCVERDEARDRQQKIADERDAANLSLKAWKGKAEAYARERDLEREESHRLLTERNEARSQQTADERICAQRDEFRIQRDAAIKERDVARDTRDRAHAEIERLKARIDEMDNSDLEPSRLEIAARIMQGWASNPNMEAMAAGPGERPANAALRIADALIAAANKQEHPVA
jgi:chromosome segregation ATPase